MHSTRYIITFVAILTTITALILALLTTGLKPIHDRNEAIYNKKAILSAIESHLSGKVSAMSADQVQGIFDNQIEQVVVGSLYTAFEADRDITTDDLMGEAKVMVPLSVMMEEEIDELRTWAEMRTRPASGTKDKVPI